MTVPSRMSTAPTVAYKAVLFSRSRGSNATMPSLIVTVASVFTPPVMSRPYNSTDAPEETRITEPVPCPSSTTVPATSALSVTSRAMSKGALSRYLPSLRTTSAMASSAKAEVSSLRLLAVIDG